METLPRPSAGEYPALFTPYVDVVPEGDIVGTLRDQIATTRELLRAVPRDRETFRYADDKWSLREVIGRVVDAERMFAFRALTFAREEDGALPGMDSTGWVVRAHAGDRPLGELVAELETVRAATISLFASLDATAGARIGTAGGRRLSVCSLAWIIAGHERWHREVIARRYLLQDTSPRASGP